MKEEGKVYCDTSKVSIQPITKSIAKEIIVKKHYTHSWTMCRYALGIYHKSDETGFFGEDKLIGCLIYGYPVGRSAPTSIVEGLTKNNVLELTRLYIDDGYGSNIESYAIAQSFKWFKQNDKAIKALLSYADNGQEHLGKIYQATNWIYQGLNTDMNLMPNYGISLTENPYEWMHSRTVFSKYGSHNIEHLKTVLGKLGHKKFWRAQESGKHRYIQILGKDKKERKQMLKNMKHPAKPYPKSAELYAPDVLEIETYEPTILNKNEYW